MSRERMALMVRLDSAAAAQAARDILADLSVEGQPVAVMRAINKTLLGMRTDVVATVRERYNISARKMREGMRIKRATRSMLVGTLSVAGQRSVPLSAFAPRPTKPVGSGGRRPKVGVSVHVLKTEPRKTIPGAFLQYSRPRGRDVEGRPLRLNVFMRETRERDSARVRFGPSYMSIIESTDAAAAIEASANERLRKHLLHESGFLKGRERGRI